MTTIQTTSLPARKLKVRGTHDGIRQYVSAGAASGTIEGYDEAVITLPNGEIEVTLHVTPAPKPAKRRVQDTRAEERFMYSVAAAGVGCVTLAITALILIVATSPLGLTAALVLAALMLLGGGGACAGLHCAGCRG